MATNPRTPVSDRPDLRLVKNDWRKKPRQSRPPVGKILSAVIALGVLVLVVRYLPAGTANTQVHAGPISVEGLTDDLQLGSLQMSNAPAGEELYLDGTAKNTGTATVTGATVAVEFHDAQGKVVGSTQKPIMGMARGGADLVSNEFARNPIQPNEMRFFRVAVEQVPPAWNHEVPELKIVEVKAQ